MKRPQAFKQLTQIVAKLLLDFLNDIDIQVADVKRIWLDQANMNMNTFVAKKVMELEDLCLDKASWILDEYANTGSAELIVAFHQYKGDLVSGEVGVLCSFGAGNSIGWIGLRWL